MYKTDADRKRAIAHLRKQGFDYMLTYRDGGDPEYPFGLNYGVDNRTWKRLSEERKEHFRTPTHFIHPDAARSNQRVRARIAGRR